MIEAALIFLVLVLVAGLGLIHSFIKDAFFPNNFLVIYRNRNCQGIYWRRRFPNVKKEDIRSFLHILFSVLVKYQYENKCLFNPDDPVAEVFTAAGDTDGMDLHDYICIIEEDYKVAVDTCFAFDNEEDVTLGQLFEYIIRNSSVFSNVQTSPSPF